MFDFVHENKRLVQVVLALIIIAFAAGGLYSYSRTVISGDELATVGDQKISPQEFSEAIKEQQVRMRNAMGPKFDPSMLEKPEVRASILDNLINQRVLSVQAGRSGLTVPDDQIREMITTIPAFQQDGAFSKSRYETLLRGQNMTVVGFESRLRQDLILQQLQETYSQSGIVPNAVIDNFIKLAEEKREVTVAIVGADKYMGKVKVELPAIKAYYDAHLADFQVPEQAKLEFVVLTNEAISSQIQVKPEDIRKYYDAHLAQFQKAEERQASHILIGIKPDAKDSDKAAAKAKAEQLAKQVQAAPATFADVAKKNSEDTGSAAQGGDLGFFGRGMMVPPFEAAVYQMKPGEIKGPIESEFGYHIIKLTAVKPGKTGSFDEVKAQIEQELKRETAGKKFAEAAEKFTDMVYEQSDSLKPASDAFKLTIQQSPWISKKDAQAAGLNNPKFLAAVFSSEALKNKRNTEAVEIAPGALISARVLEYKPAATRSLNEVNAEIGARLQREEATTLAIKEGKEQLALLQQGKPTTLTWMPTQEVTRQKQQGLPEEAAKQIFRADPAKLPVYAGAEIPQAGFTIFKVTKVVPAPAIDDAKRASYSQRLRQLFAQGEFASYLSNAKQKVDVKIKKENVDKKEQL